MKIHIAVLDDDPQYLSLISKGICEAYALQGAEALCSSFTSAADLMQSDSLTVFDQFFLDIDLPEDNGIHVAEELNTMLIHPVIIFVTNRDELVYEAIRVQPFRYIRKSHFDEEINEEAQAFLALKNRKDGNYISFESGGIAMRFNIEDIIYIEAQNQNILISTADQQTHRIRHKISDAESMLEGKGFIRIHKGYLVNCRYINVIRKDTVILDDRRVLPLSKYRKEEVKMAFLRFTDRMMNQ